MGTYILHWTVKVNEEQTAYYGCCDKELLIDFVISNHFDNFWIEEKL